MIHCVKFLMLAGAALTVAAAPVAPADAGLAANHRLERDGMAGSFSIEGASGISSVDGTVLAYVFELAPAGYVVVPADDALPPVMAYSYTSGFWNGEGQTFGMSDLLRIDLEKRMSCIDLISGEAALANTREWEAALSGSFDPGPAAMLEQWPPSGSTPTGGWLWENWTQGSPYNAYCPMDLNAGSRSVAGCPAVAMGMIVDNLETTNSTRFSDSDDYHHVYLENYWIDDDHVAHDFPSWPELNGMLDILDTHYGQSTPLTNSDKAALVFACGSACKQVYSASGSGTFGVGQAHDAYIRFGFEDCELLDAESDSLFEKLSQNMMDALPAHLAIVDAAWQYGHNIVVDGYNTDDYYHFNFGWGGSTNGWYQFPLSGMPYQMNIIEGLVLNIRLDSTGIDPEDPAGFVSLRCQSNPCPSDPSISIDLALPGHAAVRVFGVDGRLEGTLLDGSLAAGSHTLTWPGGLPTGVYIVRADAGSAYDTLRLVVLE